MCDTGINNTIVLVKSMINLIQILGPIICIITLMILFAKITRFPDDKKLDKKVKNTLIALVVVFFIPLSVNILMYYLGDNYDFTKCWNESRTLLKSSDNYITVDEKENKKNKINTNPGEYEKGDAKGYGAIADLAVKVTPYAAPDNTTIYAPSNFHDDSVSAKCGSYNTPNPWYPPSKVDSKYAEYEKLMDSVYNDQHPGNKAYGSCAQAAGGIIRATVDPDFETGNPTLQLKYLNSSSKWKKIKTINAGENFDKNLEPGDLLVTTTGWEHTMIYVGNKAVKKKFPNSNGNIFQAGYNDCEYAKYPRIDYYDSAPVPFEVFRPVK